MKRSTTLLSLSLLLGATLSPLYTKSKKKKISLKEKVKLKIASLTKKQRQVIALGAGFIALGSIGALIYDYTPSGSNNNNNDYDPDKNPSGNNSIEQDANTLLNSGDQRFNIKKENAKIIKGNEVSSSSGYHPRPFKIDYCSLNAF